MHDHAFGNLQLQEFGCHARLVQGVPYVAKQARVGELSRRQVHRDAQCRHALALPSHILRTGGLDDPFANRHNQPRFLSKRNEMAGQQQAAIGMLPTQ
jgi:hypothetical protein